MWRGGNAMPFLPDPERPRAQQQPYESERPHITLTGAACAWCLTTEKELSRCGKCKHAWYCSRECQRHHYQQHKEACYPLERFNNLLTTPQPYNSGPPGFTNMDKRMQCMLFLGHIMGNQLSWDTGRSVMYEQRCSLCTRYRHDVDNRLVNCPTCHWGWACATCAPLVHNGATHKALCPQFQLANKVQELRYNMVQREGKWPTRIPAGLRATFEPVPPSWAAYNKWRPVTDAPSTSAECALYSSRMSQVLTVMAALQHHHATETVRLWTSLRIQVIGAAWFEVPAFNLWEEVLHLMPGLTTLYVDFIGPELNVLWPVAQREHIHGKEQREGVCPTCSALGRSLVYTHYLCKYSGYAELVKAQAPSPAPAVAVLFHSNAVPEEPEAWQSCIKTLVAAGTPVAFTSVTKLESTEGNAGLWKACGGRITLPPAKNPFASLEPVPHPLMMEEEIVHMNGWWCCGAGKAGAGGSGNAGNASSSNNGCGGGGKKKKKKKGGK